MLSLTEPRPRLEKPVRGPVRGDIRLQLLGDLHVHREAIGDWSSLLDEEEDPELAKLGTALDRRIGEAQLPELILSIDAEVRFSWIMLGRQPRSTHELLMVYAGILAHGTALSAAETARMIPQLSAPAVRQAMRWAADERRLAEACSAVLTFMQHHPSAASWGRLDLLRARVVPQLRGKYRSRMTRAS